MIWKINHWQFNPSKQTLKDGKHTINLEPIQSDVLNYFCVNPGKIISRDELLEHIWLGQIVTENAINKVIAKLRKSLGDDAKSGSFISTHPKKGYKLIAKITLINDKLKKPYSYLTRFFIVTLLVSIGLSIGWYFFQHESKQYFSKAVALTRGGGAEYEPTMSPDGRYMAYSKFENDTYNLYLKQFSDGQDTLISDGVGNAGGSSWSFDGEQLIYLYTQKEVCQFKLLDISEGQVQNEKVVHNCPLKNYGNVAFSHNRNQIIYSEKSPESRSYYLFTMNLDTSEKIKLNQPPTFLAGNAEFNVHPHENKLLISSPDEQQWLVFYQLDLDNDELSYLFKKNEHLCCAIWNHNGDKVITMSPHPANGMLEIDLTGQPVRTIYESTHYVRKPIRIQHDNTYMYSGGIDNFDIQYYDLQDGRETVIADSSEVDELPRLSSDKRTLAFISRRSGMAQIWQKNLKTGSVAPVSSFSDHAKYYDFKWAPDDKHLAALVINGIKLIDKNTGEDELLKLSQQEIRGLSWVNAYTIAFSMKVGGQWRVHQYNIQSFKTTILEAQWAFINYAASETETAFINQDDQLFINNKKINLMGGSSPVFYRRFGFQVSGTSIFHYIQKDGDLSLYETNMISMKSKRIMELAYNGFSSSDDGIYFSQLSSQTADIYKLIR